MSPAPLVDTGKDGLGMDSFPTQSNAIANSKIVAEFNAKQLNASVLHSYNLEWQTWAMQVAGGYAHNPIPPQPPMAWTTAVTSTDGYWNVIPGTVPICAVPPTPPGPPAVVPQIPNYVAVGIAVVGNPGWFTALPQDGAPTGYITPPGAKSADGVDGPFRKFCTPFGGVYERV